MREVLDSPFPECVEREIDLEYIRQNALFYIIDKIECKTIAILWDDSPKGFRGFQFYERPTGWEFNPLYSSAELIDWYLKQERRYDITLNFGQALRNCVWRS